MNMSALTTNEGAQTFWASCFIMFDASKRAFQPVFWKRHHGATSRALKAGVVMFMQGEKKKSMTAIKMNRLARS